MLKSVIFKRELVKSPNQKFNYYPCFVKRSGEFALFTETELKNAIQRGQKNKEEYSSLFKKE